MSDDPRCPCCDQPVANGIQSVVGIQDRDGNLIVRQPVGPLHLACVVAIVVDAVREEAPTP
jgi:hypothetical protein